MNNKCDNKSGGIFITFFWISFFFFFFELKKKANTVFGLLGPNGAGKTTLISILTGLYPPTNGTATMVGFQIPRDIKNIYMNIGIILYLSVPISFKFF